MDKVYDFIVIGAGTAGGILAHNLTKAGANCLLIEAGKHFTKETFPHAEADASAQMYWGGGIEFDKTAKMLGLPYPGGPRIEQLAVNGDPGAFEQHGYTGGFPQALFRG